MSEYFRSFRRT